MAASNLLAAFLDQAERSGKLNVNHDEIVCAFPSLSPDALRQALHRQQKRGRIIRLSRGSGHWLIVPLQYALSGAPPLESWLDRYLSQTLNSPYYVSLLSAAEIYGASPYGVMVTQIAQSKPRRPIKVGRHKLMFHIRADLERLPIRWHETQAGRYRVSTPELTALELVQYDKAVGGMGRVREVLRGLWDACSAAGFLETLEALQEVPTAQRLGALLALDGRGEMALQVRRWLQTKPIRIIGLEQSDAPVTLGLLDTTFKVRLPTHFRKSNS